LGDGSCALTVLLHNHSPDTFHKPNVTNTANINEGISDAGPGGCGPSTTHDSSAFPAMSIACANCGDSRALLVRGLHAHRLSPPDHKPNRIDEKRRIESAGGIVGVLKATGSSNPVWRVTRNKGGLCLAVSRALGDIDLKEPAPLVISTPEVRIVQLLPEDSMIVLACDGIWDVMDEQAVANIAIEHYGNPTESANAVIRSAFQRGSHDNLTVSVIEFEWAAAHLADALKAKEVRDAAEKERQQRLHDDGLQSFTSNGAQNEPVLDMFA